MLVRECEPADAPVLGDICYRAFTAVAGAHNFAPDFPSPGAARAVIAALIANPGFYGVVAHAGHEVIGSNFLDERDPIRGVGPITIDPERQDAGAGRLLMEAVLERSRSRGAAGVRLVQAAYHSRSLALYLKLGFETRQQLACLQGPPTGPGALTSCVRPARSEDLTACNRLCARVHGHARGGELAEAVARGAARVVAREGAITGYATAIAFSGHAVAETSADLEALIGAAPEFGGPGFLVPTANGELMRWCLGRGLRITQTLTLMSSGLYNRPQGAWLPSVSY